MPVEYAWVKGSDLEFLVKLAKIIVKEVVILHPFPKFCGGRSQ